MRASDNRQTQALRLFFGQSNINATAMQIGMKHTLYQHTVGCNDDAKAHPNQMTLVDAGMLYEGVATGVLFTSSRTSDSRTSFYSVMTGKGSPVWQELVNIVKEESADMTGAKQHEFINAMDLHYKKGGYEIDDLTYNSLTGSVTISFRMSRAPAREFVFGIFVVQARNKSMADEAWGAARAEILRDHIREALRSW